MQHAICYISTATKDFTETGIRELLNKWKEKNNRLNIKGLLLYSQGHFFQVLEGEKTTVMELFNSITTDSRHTGIIQIMGKDITRGSFDDYRVEHLKEGNFSRPKIISEYCESVKGMDPETQQQIKTMLQSFIDTQVL
ncbi:Sensors of blue-light using FAD [Salinimicrobium catena]|uniref:Sensors of blue-light using FAD n=1 Tax=Salinimicrobium catena TaxID=390640 RepID=A0A1H5IQI5_9FLAO|nr:BLUF domain-containing protein [Salinimicrobium catena]SDK79601.1 Sensors of blue-light using FAD [Salinimicrobium catena]SEE42410.1 Sensors of blue-light using FAD [Salinimicrobium catena]